VQEQQARAEQRLAAYRALNEKFRQLVSTGALQVSFRNGQMVLQLPSEVLFASGRANLSRAGQQALGKVLDVLRSVRDRRFLIAGHTDDRKIRSRRFNSNWELSTARAVSVVQFMVANGFEPGNLGAAGYGAFDPVVPNDSPENMAKNRRIEIILVPDLSELPNLDAP
jgi:chemotaxis protein MotB